MDKKYFTYKLEEILDDKDFINWVLHKTNDKEWKDFLEMNPEQAPVFAKAHQIIKLLNSTDDNLSEEDILIIWKNLENFDNQNKKSGVRINLSRVLKYAAILIFIVTTGITGIKLLHKNNQPYEFSLYNETLTDGETRLLLSNGDDILLKKDISKITVNDGKEIQIDNDSVVMLSEQKIGKNENNGMNEVIVPHGKKSQLLLADGTKVWLNAGSRFAFPSSFNGKSREVFLEGEAYLEVKENVNLPFFVNTKDIRVKVLGTKFNVSAYASDQMVETILIEGKVSVLLNQSFAFAKENVVLAPFQKADFNRLSREIQVNNEPDADSYITWTEGWLCFSGENLVSVMKRLERYYNVEIQVDVPSANTERISGKLDLKESLQDVLTALSDVTPISCRIDGEIVSVKSKIAPLPVMK